MKNSGLPRIVIGIIGAFIALTAIGGGLALVFGLEANRFPLEWLQGTPFASYTIPGLLLAIFVGGSSLVAAYTAFTRRPIFPLTALAAGAIMMGYIVIEVLILKQTPPGPTVIEITYFVLGLALLGLGWFVRRRR